MTPEPEFVYTTRGRHYLTPGTVAGTLRARAICGEHGSTEDQAVHWWRRWHAYTKDIESATQAFREKLRGRRLCKRCERRGPP